LDFDWCKNPDKGLIQPDLVFFIDVNPEETKLRSGYGDERYEKYEFQKKVYE
jgi:dTMP kinase